MRFWSEYHTWWDKMNLIMQNSCGRSLLCSCPSLVAPYDDFEHQVLRQTRWYLLNTQLCRHCLNIHLQLDVFLTLLARVSCFVATFVNSVTLSNVKWSTRPQLDVRVNFGSINFHNDFPSWLISNCEMSGSRTSHVALISPLWEDMITANSLTTARILNSLRESSIFPVTFSGGNRCRNFRAGQAEL